MKDRRSAIRRELDAAFFHLYGISREDAGYIMETFPIVKRKEEERFGEYRTKRAILEIYDALAEAIRMDPLRNKRLSLFLCRDSLADNARFLNEGIQVRYRVSHRLLADPEEPRAASFTPPRLERARADLQPLGDPVFRE